MIKNILFLFLCSISMNISAQNAKVFYLLENSYQQEAQVYQDSNTIHLALKPFLFSEINIHSQDSSLYLKLNNKGLIISYHNGSILTRVSEAHIRSWNSIIQFIPYFGQAKFNTATVEKDNIG